MRNTSFMKLTPPVVLLIAAMLLAAGLARAQDPKLAPDDLADFAKATADGHLIAQVVLQTGEKTFARYRYDRYPTVQRILQEDGSMYLSEGQGIWHESAGWTSPDSSRTLDAKETEKLDNCAALVTLPFQKPVHLDKTQGVTMWRLAGKSAADGYESFIYEQSRRNPRKDGFYPHFTFIKHAGIKDGHLALQWFEAQVRWGGALVPVKVKYDFKAEKTPGVQPEELLFFAKRLMDRGPVKVDARANGDANCRITGVLSGKDSDLTVTMPDRAFRQIVSGADCWTSGDGGATWKKQSAPDWRYYFLAHTPVKYDPRELIPPFEIVGDTQEDAGGLSVRSVRLLAPETVRYDGDRSAYRLSMKHGWPAGILHFDGPLLFGKNYVIVHADYTSLEAKEAVQPPPEK